MDEIYFNTVNWQVFGEIDPDARAVCEFGCGAGAMARACKERLGQHVHYVGVELMEEPLQLAREALDVGLQRNLDQLPPDWDDDPELAAALPLEEFDHLIFADVLEHLYDPAAILKQAIRRLTPGGTVLACIPNVQHWTVFATLVAGRWPQEDEGIFDRTHIRWFTLTDMVQLMQGCGLTVEKIITRVKPNDLDRGMQLMELLKPASSFVGGDPEALFNSGQAFQYVLVGRKPVESVRPSPKTSMLGRVLKDGLKQLWGGGKGSSSPTA